MANRIFNRRKDAPAPSEDSIADLIAPRPAPQPLDGPDTIIDLTTDRSSLSESERTAQYNDWADRMRAKRARAKEAFSGSTDTGPTYWTTDALYAESKRVQETEVSARPDPSQLRDLLAVLDLAHDASPAEVGQAYKRLAKAHHPDRFAATDPDTQRQHAERMADINQAYKTLKLLNRA